MIGGTYGCHEIRESQVFDYVWRRLSRYQDIDASYERLTLFHPDPLKKHKENMKKQCKQISFCIDQAREYFTAAKNASLITKPLLAYYGLTSIANAELMWFGNGDVALDRRPKRFNSHGLELAMNDGLLYSSVKVLADKDGPNGLFGLWAKTAIIPPQFSKHKTRWASGVETTALRQAIGPTPITIENISNKNFKIIDILSRIPLLHGSVKINGLGRGIINTKSTIDENNATKSFSYSFILHRAPNRKFYESFVDSFKFYPEMYNDVNIIETNDSCIINVNYKIDKKFFIRAPYGHFISENEMYFDMGNEDVNEFMLFYFCLYFAGMIARYHPHLWMDEVRNRTEFASLIEELVDISTYRVPQLALSNLDQRLYVYDN